MNNEMKPTPASEIVGKNREPVKCDKTGNVYIIRGISPIEFYGSSGLPTGKQINMQDQEKAMKEIKEDVESNTNDYLRVILKRGIVSPKIVIEGDPDISKNEMAVEDIPTDDFKQLLPLIEKKSKLRITMPADKKKQDGL